MAPISRTVALFVACAGSADALVPSRWTPSSARATAAPRGRGSSVVVNMGLFDGLKEAFNPDAESQGAAAALFGIARRRRSLVPSPRPTGRRLHLRGRGRREQHVCR